MRIVSLIVSLAAVVAITLLCPRPDPASSTGVAGITGGGNHTCAVTTLGGVKCWGSNFPGQLGDGTVTVIRTTPVDVLAAPLGSPLLGIAAVEAGGSHTCALTTLGGVKCWGRNDVGQVGDGTTTDRYVPADVSSLRGGLVAVAPGSNHTCALNGEGYLKCWGSNTDGQLGDGTTNDAHEPVDVTGAPAGTAVSVSAGGDHTCAVIATGGVWCWGNNDYGELGDGSTNDASVPVPVVGLGSGVASIAAGVFHTCALITTGDVKCWGLNNSGQLGNGSTVDSAVPVDVAGIPPGGAAAVSAGRNHTCVLTTDGGVKCWGANNAGQVGNGTTSEVIHLPVNVVGLGSGVAALAAGGKHNCVLTDEGSLKCWGHNDNGELGDGMNCGTICRSPVEVDPSVKATPTATITATASPTAVLVLTPTDTPPPTNTPGPTSTVAVMTPTPDGTIGDVSCDGIVNSIDAALILQLGAGLIASLPCEANGDVNLDGAIDAVDAALILQFDAGLIPGLPP